MSSSDASAVARDLLAALQDAVAAKDLDRVVDLFSDDVVLFGTAAANLDREHSVGYVEQVMAQDGVLRWDFDEVVTLLSEPDLVSFAAVGTVGFEDERGQPKGRRDRFRLTCLAVKQGDGWRLRHFHGSVPQE